MYKEIDVTSLETALEKDEQAIVIDVRTWGEVQGGMVPGSLHIDLFGPGFLEQIKVLDKSKTYYIICRSGNRSDSVAGAMNNMGFENVNNVLGGMIYWQGKLEYPSEKIQSRSA